MLGKGERLTRHCRRRRQCGWPNGATSQNPFSRLRTQKILSSLPPSPPKITRVTPTLQLLCSLPPPRDPKRICSLSLPLSPSTSEIERWWRWRKQASGENCFLAIRTRFRSKLPPFTLDTGATARNYPSLFTRSFFSHSRQPFSFPSRLCAGGIERSGHYHYV